MKTKPRPRHAAATDQQIRALLVASLSAHDDLTAEQRATLADDLMAVVVEAVRIKRPVWRPEDHNAQTLAYQQRINDETREKATHYAQPYTGKELETLMRDDLTDQQIAKELGRTLYAVKTKRKKMRAAAQLVERAS